MKRVVVAIAAAGLALGLACSGERSPSGLGEPIRVRNAVFKEGPLPGSPPAAGAAPAITAIETASTVLRPRQGDKTLSGRASPSAVAVALALGGGGSGYWLLPVDGPDPQNAGELGWQALVEVDASAPVGPRELLFVAIDAAGQAGSQRALGVCVPRAVPDNLNGCDRAIAPPAAVVSLTWDTPVDLDLVAVAPDGRIIDAKHPGRPVTADGGVGSGSTGDAGASAPTIDRDSNASCALDRIQQENLIFADPPPPGSYLVFANLFHACERPIVHFAVEVHVRQAAADGRLDLVSTETRRGTLGAVNVNAASPALGTFVTEVAF